MLFRQCPRGYGSMRDSALLSVAVRTANALRPRSTECSRVARRFATVNNQILDPDIHYHVVESSTRATVVQILNNISSKRDIERCISQFELPLSEQLTLINVNGTTLTKHLRTISAGLAFLARLGYPSVVVHGLDVTAAGPKSIGISRAVLLEQNLRLVEELERQDIMTRPITCGVFTAHDSDLQEKFPSQSVISQIDERSVVAALQAGCMPIITSMAESQSGRYLDVNGDVAAYKLARALRPTKIIHLTENGGLYHGKSREKLSVINLDQDYEKLIAHPLVRQSTRSKIKEIRDTLVNLPKNSCIAIMHPVDLKKEPFTGSGTGTVVREGNKIHINDRTLGPQDLRDLKAALTRSHKANNAETWKDGNFERLVGRNIRVYHEESMDAAAIVLLPDHNDPIPYLMALTGSKPSWLRDVVDTIFATIRKDFSSLTWIVDENHDNLTWFFNNSDGNVSRNGKVLFWFGLRSSPDVENAMAHFFEHDHEDPSKLEFLAPQTCIEGSRQVAAD